MALAIAAALLSRDVMPRWRVAHKTVVADTRPLPKLNALRTVAAFVALVENPGAASAFVAGDDAERAAAALRAAGVRCAGGDAGHDGPAPREDAGHDGPAPQENGPAPQEYDVVLWAGEAPGDWGCALEKVAAAGVLVWAFDAHRMKAAEFKAALEAFPCEKAHLWMPGERDWILAGRKDGGAVKMSEVLDVFSRPEAVTPEAEEAGCGSMQELFANYVGSRADIMPAFESGDMSAKVRPEFFVSRETPDLDWIVPDDMDADIVLALAEKIRAMQDVRRKIVGACARSYEPDGMDDAVRDWAEAMKANPHDTMLLDRLYLMAVNARAFHDVGNIAGAAQCYEAMVAIRPGDRRVVMEYARCLKSLGKTDKAAAVERSLREKDAEQRL
jgi:hypothetical protein